MNSRDKDVLLYTGLAFLALGIAIFFFGCNVATPQTSSQESRQVAESPAIPVKSPTPKPSPTEVKESHPEINTMAILIPMISMILINQFCTEDGAINNECVGETLACLTKLSLEDRMNPGKIADCAEKVKP